MGEFSSKDISNLDPDGMVHLPLWMVDFFMEHVYGGFLKWWYPASMGFPTKSDHFGVFGGYHHLRKHPYR